jgi:hypothetical protein
VDGQPFTVKSVAHRARTWVKFDPVMPVID